MRLVKAGFPPGSAGADGSVRRSWWSDRLRGP